MEYQPTYAANLNYKLIPAIISEGAPRQPADYPIRLSHNISECVVFRVYNKEPLDETLHHGMKPFTDVAHEVMTVDINTERFALMAEKYVGVEWSREKEARLQIDHAKIVKMFPRVENAQIEQLARESAEWENRAENVDVLLNDLNIK